MRIRFYVGLALAVIGVVGGWAAATLIRGPMLYWKDPLIAGHIQLALSVISLSAMALGVLMIMSVLLARRAAKAEI